MHASTLDSTGYLLRLVSQVIAQMFTKFQLKTNQLYTVDLHRKISGDKYSVGVREADSFTCGSPNLENIVKSIKT